MSEASELGRQINDEVWADIHAFDASRPRSLQKSLGWSELGDPCDRKLAFKAARVGKSNPADEKWKAIKGTALHAMMELVLADNPEWILEKRLGRGRSDAYNWKHQMVVDWKFPGSAVIQECIRKGVPAPVYRRQGHGYGKEWEEAGYPVKFVSIQYFPGEGKVRHGWCEPYDISIAQEALDRYAGIEERTKVLQLQAHPANINEFPKHPSFLCNYCPFFGTAAQEKAGTGCAGPNQSRTATQVLDD